MLTRIPLSSNSKPFIPLFVKLAVYFGAECIVQLRLEEFWNSDRLEGCEGWLGLVQSYVHFVKLVVFHVDKVDFIR